MTHPAAYLAHVKSVFKEKGNSERAQGQRWYMRYQFEFYGLKSPEWNALANEIFAESGMPAGEDLKTFVRLCYDDKYREIQYFGTRVVQLSLKDQPADFLFFLEELIQTKSWWDTVDWLAQLAGEHFRRYPHLTLPLTGRWMASGNFWLQRTCLLFQRSYKEQTDFGLMKKYILLVADSKEFFLQKGAGWALRQYSKTNPQAVLDFIGNNAGLAPLTKREGLKWIRKNSKTLSHDAGVAAG